MIDMLENDDVLNFFIADRSLISATVNSIHIFELDGSLTVDLDISLLYSKEGSNYRIRFADVTEYSFYHTSDHHFYNIANLKFFKEKSSYYISLDPDEEIKSRSGGDNDYILSNKIQAVALNA